MSFQLWSYNNLHKNYYYKTWFDTSAIGSIKSAQGNGLSTNIKVFTFWLPFIIIVVCNFFINDTIDVEFGEPRFIQKKLRARTKFWCFIMNWCHFVVLSIYFTFRICLVIRLIDAISGKLRSSKFLA
jgi:hypothetical protein